MGERGGAWPKNSKAVADERSIVYLPSIAIGKCEDVMLIILQTRDTACGENNSLC